MYYLLVIVRPATRRLYHCAVTVTWCRSKNKDAISFMLKSFHHLI